MEGQAAGHKIFEAPSPAYGADIWYRLAGGTRGEQELLLRDRRQDAALHADHRADDRSCVRARDQPGEERPFERQIGRVVFQDHAAGLKKDSDVQIFATDIDRDAIDRARRGVYPSSIAADISPERLKRFFFEQDNIVFSAPGQVIGCAGTHHTAADNDHICCFWKIFHDVTT